MLGFGDRQATDSLPESFLEERRVNAFVDLVERTPPQPTQKGLQVTYLVRKPWVSIHGHNVTAQPPGPPSDMLPR
jgi:hypothetical protein